VAQSSLAACRLGCVTLLVVALCRCGLSSTGSGVVGTPDAAAGPGGSSGYSSGGSLSGTSTSSTSSSGSSPTGSSGGDDADTPDQAGDDVASLSARAEAGTDSRPTEAGSKDAAAEGGAGAICSMLATCCSLLQAYGTSATSIQSCREAAASNNATECETALGPLQSLGLCL
jgi:hypothetical protein